MLRNLRWPVPVGAGALAVVLAVGLAGCGTNSAPPAGSGNGASINMSLNTVPVVRSVTVSPAKGAFTDCRGGNAGDNTASTRGELGYPNGRCWYGQPEPHGRFPITITNTGIASQIDVSGESAYPSDNGDQWSLCNTGHSPVTLCTGTGHKAPGTDQYKLENFSPDNGVNSAGITGAWLCDRQFGQGGTCTALQGTFQTEGFELVGPATTTDNSTSWTVTITWMPVPR
jgi:hypothetical protein